MYRRQKALSTKLGILTLILFGLFAYTLSKAGEHNRVFALVEDPFTTDYAVSYKVTPTGLTEVTQEIDIANRYQDVTATNYALTIRKMRIFDVQAFEKNDDLEIEQVEDKDEDKTEIKIQFNNYAVGKGSRNELKIDYKTFDIASKVGEVWNIQIPKVNLISTTTRYDVKLTIPKAFGPEIFVSPLALLKEEDNTNYIYTFTKDQLFDKGISGSFGKFQVLNFKLEYDIENTSTIQARQRITLPPDIKNIQQVSVKTIDPLPERTYLDEDGNVIAEYSLDPKSTKNIKVVGSARIIGRQINPAHGARKNLIPRSLVSSYTQPTEYWQSDHEIVKEIAKNLMNEERTVSENAYEAYKFVTENLDYDFDLLNSDFVERKGAAKALESINMANQDNASEETELVEESYSGDIGTKNGCMEFTDAFIAILRAMGIPARELNGFAFSDENSTSNPVNINLRSGDTLHAWAEYYDPEFGWVPVDPTWGSTSELDYFTKLDTSHLVFVIKGKDPVFPLPAGTYKLDQSKKQINVDFAVNVEEKDFEPVLNSYLAKSLNPLNKLRNLQKLSLKNEGNITLYFEGDIMLLPGKSVEMYFPSSAVAEKSVDIKYQDAIGKEYTTIDNYYEQYVQDFTFYYLIAFGVILLCVSFYLLVIRPRFRKR